MRYLKIFEEWESRESKYPPIYSGDEYINNEDGLVYVCTDNFMDKIFYHQKDNKGETFRTKTSEFIKNFTKVKPNVVVKEEPKKDIYVNYDNEVEMDFNNSIYLSDEKAIIGAYMITKNAEKYIEVLNIKEYENQAGAFMDNTPAYSVSIHKENLPISQIEIISKVSGKEGFSFIKIPYWLYKEKPNLAIKKCKLNFDRKRLSLTDSNLKNNELMKMFNDPDVEEYFKYSDPDERTQQLVQLYKKRKI